MFTLRMQYLHAIIMIKFQIHDLLTYGDILECC